MTKLEFDDEFSQLMEEFNLSAGAGERRNRIDMKKDVIIIDQGHFMETPSPSIINVDLDKKDGKITGLMAGGYGRSMKEMEINLETAAS